jgi:hypothetical protein
MHRHHTLDALLPTPRRTLLHQLTLPLLTLSSPPLTTPSAANAIETYLTEPTEEFKESERQRIEFRKKKTTLAQGRIRLSLGAIDVGVFRRRSLGG